MIAALYVETDGHYFGLPGVDAWNCGDSAMSGQHPDELIGPSHDALLLLAGEGGAA